MLRKIEKLKQAKKDNKAAQAAARKDAAAAARGSVVAEEEEEAADGSLDPDADYDQEGSDAEQHADGHAFAFAPPPPAAGGPMGFHFGATPSPAARGGLLEDGLVGLSMEQEAVTTTGLPTGAAPLAAGTVDEAASVRPSECLPFGSCAEVDATFESAWEVLQPVVNIADHRPKAENALDHVLDAVGGTCEAEADAMSDRVAAAAAGGEAAATLAMLQEVLCWRVRARHAAAIDEGAEAALVAAEAAARVLHQLLTLSRSWGMLTQWKDGVKQVATTC